MEERNTQKISVDFKAREIVFFHKRGRVNVYPLTAKRLKTLRAMTGYSENNMGVHTAYVPGRKLGK